MKKLILDIIHMNNDYTGTGMFLGLFFAILMYLLFIDKDEERKKIYTIPAFVTLIGVYVGIPVVNLVYPMDTDIMGRAFWLLVIPFGVALGMTLFVKNIKDSRLEIIAIIIMLPLIFFCGTFKLSSSFYDKPANAYKLPEDVIAICDYVLENKKQDDVEIIVPYEISNIPRQYSTHIKMLFGENATFGRIVMEWDEELVKACEEMTTMEPDLNYLGEMADKHDVEYIVFDSVYHCFGGNSVNTAGYTESIDFVGERAGGTGNGEASKITVNSEGDNLYWDLSAYSLEYVGTYGQFLLYRYK